MKKFENLGKKLSKDEQKNIMGGVGDGGPACNSGGCTLDSQCGQSDCICGILQGETNARCHKLV